MIRDGMTGRLGLSLIVVFGLVTGASAQTGPADRPSPAPPETVKSRAAPLDVGIVAGPVSASELRLVSELAAVLDGERLRILPVIGRGGRENVEDLFRTRRVDAALVQLDVLAHLRRDRAYGGIERQMQFLAKLHNAEIHLLARDDVRRVDDLVGKKVNIGVEGDGAVTAATLFDALGLRIEATHDDQALALVKLRAGEIAAMLFVSAKPAALIGTIGAGERLHLLALPAVPALFDIYLPTQFDAGDYPRLVAQGQRVDTLAVGVAMMVATPDPAGERAYKLARLVETMFSRIDELQQPPRHPKWREISLSAQLPGWTRFQAAQDWLRRTTASLAAARPSAGADVNRALFERFSTAEGVAPGGQPSLSDRDRDALFRRFLDWRNAREN